MGRKTFFRPRSSRSSLFSSPLVLAARSLAMPAIVDHLHVFKKEQTPADVAEKGRQKIASLGEGARISPLLRLI